MYAARAAAAMNDTATLTRLSLDDRRQRPEATLPPLRRLQARGERRRVRGGAPARRTTSCFGPPHGSSKGPLPSPALASALGAALERVTAEKKETSRDPRMALIERLGELGTETDGPCAPAAAARLRSRRRRPPRPRCCARWTGEEVVVDPQLLPRAPLPDRRRARRGRRRRW